MLNPSTESGMKNKNLEMGPLNLCRGKRGNCTCFQVKGSDMSLVKNSLTGEHVCFLQVTPAPAESLSELH